jgi:WD40 repeat protein
MSAYGYAESPAATGLNPFPGLRPFEADEDYLFFGRERQTDELLRKLRTTRFLSILGRSGSGKSSLVRSGMIPTLYGGGMTRAGSSWRVAIMRPGEDPLGNLALALAAPGALAAPEARGTPEGKESLTSAFFETTLRASQRGLIECIRQARIRPTDNILVLVDQFEELFRYRRSRRVVGRDEAVAFVKLLLAARESEVPCYIAITMRSDFIGDCMEFGTLPEVINDGIYLVPRMTRDELRSAITGPVAVGGATIAPRLVSRLLNDVGDDPDQLPILQHALMRTWEQWEAGKSSGPLDLHHYEGIGTMREALSRHAEESYGELDARGQAIAEKLFKALTDKGSDVRGVRRPAPMSEICALTGASLEVVAAVVECFRKPGRSFLMPPAGVPLGLDSILDISHESLMRLWERLSAWSDDEARAGQLYLNVARAAQRHEEGVAALWRDPELQLALTWREKEAPTAEWAARYDPSFERAMAFLDASREERDREILEKETRRRRELRQARVLAVILASASLITMGLGGLAYSQKEKADQQAVRADKARQHAEDEQRRAETQQHRAQQERQRAEAEKRRAETEQQRAQAEQQRAEQEKTRAEQQTEVAEQQRAAAESERVRADTERKNAEANAIAAQKAKVAADEARGAAVKSEQDTRRLSHLAAARALALKIPQMKDQPDRAALLAVEAYRLHRENGGSPQDPDIYEAMRSALDRLQPLPTFRGGQDGLRALATLPEGSGVVAGTDDGRLLRYDLAQSGAPSSLGGLSSPVRSIAVRSAGDLLAAGGAGGEIRLFDLHHLSGLPQELPGGHGSVSSLAFEPGGSRLAAGTLDGSVTLWDVGRREPAATFAGSGGKRITAVALSNDGKLLAAGLAGGGALLWEVAQPAAQPRTVCPGLDVRSLAFRPDAGVLACGGSRGEIIQTRLGAGAALPPLLGHRASVNSLAFDRRGELLASGSSDKDVRIWSIGNAGAQPVVLTGNESWVWGVAFGRSGDRVLSAGEDRTLRIWPARSEVLADDLCREVGGRTKKELTRDEWRQSMPSNLPYREGGPCPAAR